MAKQNIFIGIAILVIVGAGIFLLSNKSQKNNSQPLKVAQNTVVVPNICDTKQKVRDKIITYTVEKGDGVNTVAAKFTISADTIKWANGLTTNALTPGQTLQILPITGVAHKVNKGETVQSLAKKYHTDTQSIVDYPFNHYANPNTFTLVEGETIIIPNGKP
jgi:LysM repeat protein